MKIKKITANHIAQVANEKYKLKAQVFGDTIRVVNPKYQFEEFLIIVNENSIELNHHNGYINHKRHRYHKQRAVGINEYQHVLESIVDHGVFKESNGDIKMMDEKLKMLNI